MEKAYMNNMLKRLLVTALAVSAAHVSAYTNQNFLSSPRAQAASVLLDNPSTRALATAKGHDRFGGNFLVSGYYSESRDAKALGKYFGFKDQDSFKANIGNNLGANDLQLGALVHDEGLAAGGAAHGATINLAPKTTSYGLELAYKQCLGKILEGLHLSVSLPVERVENNMNLTVTAPLAAGDDKLITDFLAGNVSRPAYGAAGYALPVGWTAANNAQAALKSALVSGKQTATGIADIQVALGYDFVRGHDWTAGLNIGLAIPTGNTATGKYVFEPIYGNGGHWELGVGGAVDGRLWHDGHQHIGLHLSADYRYGFQANENRTLGLNSQNWGQYYLVGVVGGANTSGVPFANTGTQSVSVTPNSSLRGNLGLEYGNSGFLVGVSYAPAWKQGESVSWNGNLPTGQNGVLGVGVDVHTNANFRTPQEIPAANLFDKTGVSTDQAKRQSQLEHRLNGNLGYTFDMDYPITLGVGGYYAFKGDNANIEHWGVNLTAGIGF